jgi:hypothetical protein
MAGVPDLPVLSAAQRLIAVATTVVPADVFASNCLRVSLLLCIFASLLV